MKPSAVLVASDLRVVKVSTVALKCAMRLKDDEYYTPLDGFNQRGVGALQSAV